MLDMVGDLGGGLGLSGLGLFVGVGARSLIL